MRKPLFSSNHHFDILICLGLVLAIFVPYHQVAGHRFIEFDDGLYAFQNTYVIRGLCWDSISWAFTNTDAAACHPLTWISLLVDRELYGPHAGGYLLEGVAWHALASCLCYWAFRRTTGSRLFGLSVALFFALHPANVENVAWLSERKSLLNAVFWFGAIISYVDFIEQRTWRAYGATAIAFLLSLLSKPMSITLPCTLVLIHALYLVYHPDQAGRVPWRRERVWQMLAPLLPPFVVSLYFTAITLVTQSIAMAAPEYTLDLRLINTVTSYGRYLAMFFHPTQLANFYPLFPGDLTLRAAVVPLLVLIVLSIGAILLVRRRPQLLIGWCWFLGTMVPVIGLVQVGSQSHADRYLYIPMVGLAFVFPVLFAELRALRVPLQRAIIGTSLVVFTVSMGAATQIQTSYWKDGVSLFNHSLQVTGDCVTTVMNLAVAYLRSGRCRETVAFANTKMAVAKYDENKAKLARYKASALVTMQKYDEAIASAQQALDWGGPDETAFWALALSHYELGEPDEAIKYVRQAKANRKPEVGSSFVAQQRGMNWTVLESWIEHKVPPRGHAAPPPAPDPLAPRS